MGFRHEPLVVSEAMVRVYAADSAGLPLTAEEVYPGGCVENLMMEPLMATVPLTATGAAHPTVRQVPTGHELTMDRLAAINRNTMLPFQPGINQQYVMVIHWTTSIGWVKRTYFGAMCMGRPEGARDLNQLTAGQRWFASRMTEETGYGPYTPAAAVLADVDQAYFGLGGGASSGRYLSGAYTWPTSRTPTKARATGLAGQTSSTVLTLEVNGVLTAHTITLATGAENAEVSAEIDISGLTVPANQGVRWKVTSAPASGPDQMTELAVVMRTA